MTDTDIQKGAEIISESVSKTIESAERALKELSAGVVSAFEGGDLEKSYYRLALLLQTFQEQSSKHIPQGTLELLQRLRRRMAIASDMEARDKLAVANGGSTDSQKWAAEKKRVEELRAGRGA